MPRRLLKRICPSDGRLQSHWFLRRFGTRIADPRLWGLCRRSVTAAFGIGLAVCFIPLPVHFVVASLLAVWLRLNIPVIYGTILLINPVTIVPVYYLGLSPGGVPAGPAPDRVCIPDELGLAPERPGTHVETVPGGLSGLWGGGRRAGLYGPGARLAVAGGLQIPGSAHSCGRLVAPPASPRLRLTPRYSPAGRSVSWPATIS